jgi:hypothetical protein
MSLPKSVGIEPASASGGRFKQVVDSYAKQGKNERKGRTGQLVVVEPKELHVDELAEFGGDRP